MRKWFIQQKPFIRLTLKFLFFIVWFYVFRLLIDLVWEDGSRIFSTRIAVSSLLLALGFTLYFQWELVKTVFSKQTSNEPTA
jgi:hypothetical protein